MASDKEKNKSEDDKQGENKQGNDSRPARGEKNIFINRYIYPDAAAIFTSQLQSVEEIKDSCLYVLDTNVLLLPYRSQEDTYYEKFIEQFRNIVGPLASSQRLIVPGQVAREFAKNRSLQLGKLYKDLYDHKSRPPTPLFASFKASLLTNLEEFGQVDSIKNKLDELAKQYRQQVKQYQEAVDRVLDRISEWRWDDPISSLYNDLFTSEVIFDPSFNEDEIKKELSRRQGNKIPPGYLDASKEDGGVGDLLIWYTILEAAKKNKRSVIFVSDDIKEDWWQKSEGNQKPLFPRFELVDEFRRKTEGHSFHILRFKDFLRLYGASDEVVEAVQQEVERLEKNNAPPPSLTVRQLTAMKLAVMSWLRTRFPQCTFEIPPWNMDTGVDYIMRQPETPTTVAIKLEFCGYERVNETKIRDEFETEFKIYEDLYLIQREDIDWLYIICAVDYDTAELDYIQPAIENGDDYYQDRTSITLGYFHNHEFEEVFTTRELG